MRPKRIVEKITAFTLSGMIALSSIAVGSITNTNQISAAQTNTKKTEASYDTSWYGKSYDEVVKLYGGSDNVQIYDDNATDQDDLAEAFSAIRENEKENENSDILNVIYINGQEENKDKLTLTINKPLSIPSNTYILAYGTINFSTGKDSEGNQTQGRFTINGSKNVCIRGNAETKFVLSSDDTNADTPIPIINIMDGSNNINIVNTSFETETDCYNSVFVSASNSSNLSFTNLKFKGNVKRAFSCSTIGNTKFTNNTISNLTIPNNESAIYISNITEGSNNTFGNLTINNINSSSNNFGYGISIVNSYDTEIKNVNIDGNKKIVGIRIYGSNEANTLYSGNTITASKINNCISKGIQIDGTVKNVTVNNTGVANTTAIPNDTNNKNYGIFIAPNYNSSSVLNPTDYIAKITGCTDTEGKDCAKDSTDCLSHIHNNGIGIYVTASGLGTEYFNNQDRANETRQILVQNNKICCNKIGIQTYSNINPIDETKAKITIGSINNVYNNNAKFQGDGIIDNSETDGDDFSETITPIEGTNYYKGYITGLKYELIGGAYTVVGNSTGYITDTTRPFVIPSKVILEGKDANISSNYTTVNAIGDNAFKNCEEPLGNGRVIVPNSITKIGKTAFQYCSALKSIYIGTDTTISEYAFHGCKNLAEIEVAKAKRTSKSDETLSTDYNRQFVSKDGVLYEIDYSENDIENLKLISYPVSHFERSDFKVYINTPGNLNNFNLSLFNYYIQQRLVYLYDNDTKECYFPEIPNNGKFDGIYSGTHLVFKDIPSYANNLTFYIGNVSGYAYNEKNNMGRINGNNKYDSLTLNYSNNKATFTYGDSTPIKKHVTNYSIPSGSDYDFSYTTRSSNGNGLNIRKFNITTLEYRCFSKANNLTSITLNKNMKEFRYMNGNKDFTACAGPFEECKNLKTIAVADGNEYFSVVGNELLNLTSLYSKDFSKFYLLPPASGVKDFTLNPNVKSIANYAFAYNPTLESVTYNGTKLYEIGVRAFYGCNKFNNFKWTKAPEYKGTQSNTTYSSLPSFLDYALTNHMVKNTDGSISYVPNNFIDGNSKDAKFRLGFSKTLLSDNLHFDKNGNLIKSAVQRMYKPLYYGVLENVEEKALAISNNNLNKNFQDFMNGSVTNFFKYSKEEENTGKWQTKQDSNSAKSGTENYDSTDTKKANNVSILNKSAKWVDKDMTKAEVNVDYSYGENRNKYNFLFVLDKTGSMNEANSASRSKMYDQYSTAYNMSKAILSDKEADNKVGIINFSDETYTDMMNGSDGSSQKITSTETVNKDTDKEYKKYTFGTTDNAGNTTELTSDNMFSANLNNIEKFLANTETEGMTEYDVGVNSIHSVLDTISADPSSDTSRKTAVIFISDGAPSKDHSGSKEATTLRNDYPNVPIYTILEFVADSDKASDSCKSAMGEISGYYYKDINDKHPSYNTYNKSGKDSNELTNAFKSIYENFTSTPKQVLQDTISQAFTTNSIKLTRTVPQYNTINLAVDVDIPDFNTVYNSLYQTSSITDDDFKLQVNPNVPNLSKHNYSPTKKIITNKHIRYVYSNVYNKTGATYKLISTNGNLNNFLSNTVKGNADGIIKTSSSGLLRIQYNVANGFSLSSSTTLLATNSGVIAKDKDGNYLATKEEYSIPVPSDNTRNYYYYYLKKADDNVTLTEISNNPTPTDFTQYYKDSLDGIVIKLYKDSKNQVHIRVFINDAQCLVKYSLNFGLILNKNSTNKYGTYFYTNDGGSNTECFVVNNNEETLTPTDDFSNYTNTSITTKIINKVPSPKLFRQKYGDIVVKVMKENFGLDSSDKTYKYFMETNSQVKDLTAVTLLTKSKDVDIPPNTQLIFGNKDSYTYKDQPLYDSNGNLYSFTVEQASSYERFNPVDSVSINSTTLLNNGTVTATLNNYLKKGPLEIKKSAFDKVIKGVYFRISNDNSYKEDVCTNDSGVASPVAKKTSRGTTNYLPVYNKNNTLIKYSVTELGNKSGNSYSIPIKYKPEKTTVDNIVLTNYKLVTVNFDNLSRDDFTTKIKNVDKNCYGDTKDNGKEFECVDITNGVPEDKKPVSTNTEGKVYENQIGSFDVTFKNKVADTKSALCEILIDGKSVYSQKLSFNNNGEKTVRVIYDYKWNIDPRKVIARINYNNKNDEIVTNDNVATTTLQPKEWFDFSVKIDGLYTDFKCTNKLPVNKANGKYYYANKGQQFYIKATFTNKNKGRAYNPPIDVLYDDSFYLEHYFLAEDIPANGSQTGVIEVTADTDLCVKDLAVHINWTGRGSEANPNDNEDKVTVEVRKVLDLSIEPIKANVPYYNDYDVVTSVMVYNKTTTEAVLPNDHVKVTFSVYLGKDGYGVHYRTWTKEVVIPACKKGEPFASNLVYFKWHVPKENKTSYIYWIATINEDQKLFEADYSDNTTNISEGRPSLEKKNDDGTPYIITNLDCLVPREDYVAKNTPSTKYEETSEDGYVEKNIGKTFDYITPNDAGLNNYNNQAIWSEWSFDSTNNKFIKHTYGQTIGKFNTSDFTTASLKSTAKLSKNSSHSETIITPDKNSPTVERDDNGNWTMRSGYGFSLKYNPKISSFYAENGVYNSNFDSLTEEEKADKLSNATTGIQMASAYYPEFMYMDKKFTDDNGNTQYTCNTLERNVLSTNLFNFNLPMNDQSASILTDHKEDSRIHFIPIWYKNGDYNISIVASYSWTPAGAISTCDNSTNINIDGSMYDDWYLTGDAH